MYISYLVECEGENGFDERIEPLNLGFKTIDFDNEMGFANELYNIDAAGKQNKIHINGLSVLTEEAKELFYNIVEESLNEGKTFLNLFMVFDYIEQSLKECSADGKCPHCGESNET